MAETESRGSDSPGPSPLPQQRRVWNAPPSNSWSCPTHPPFPMTCCGPCLEQEANVSRTVLRIEENLQFLTQQFCDTTRLFPIPGSNSHNCWKLGGEIPDRIVKPDPVYSHSIWATQDWDFMRLCAEVTAGSWVIFTVLPTVLSTYKEHHTLSWRVMEVSRWIF